MEKLIQKLKMIDNQNYKEYRSIEGIYHKSPYILIVEHTQSDPFANPSIMIIKIPQKNTGIDQKYFQSNERKTALADFLHRRFEEYVHKIYKPRQWTGNSNLIKIVKTNQFIYQRSAVIIKDYDLEFRFYVGLPSKGRNILGFQAIELFQALITLMNHVCNLDPSFGLIDNSKLDEHILFYELFNEIQSKLDEKGLIAFIGEKAKPLRESYLSDLPCLSDSGVNDQNPVHSFLNFSEKAMITFDTQHGKIKGLGIGKGITLIMGDINQGKSTLVNALSRSVFPKIPGDGRELIIAKKDLCYIRSDQGRMIAETDLSMFYEKHKEKWTHFSSKQGSGVISQQANFIEAFDSGCRNFIMDQDTSSQDFLQNNFPMNTLLQKIREQQGNDCPETLQHSLSLLNFLNDLTTHYSVSLILAGQKIDHWIPYADQIFLMEDGLLSEISETPLVKDIKQKIPAVSQSEVQYQKKKINLSLFDLRYDSADNEKSMKIMAKGIKKIVYGSIGIDTSSVSQIFDDLQLNTLAQAIYALSKIYSGEDLSDLVQSFSRELDKEGFKILTKYPSCDYAFFRPFELQAVINRIYIQENRGK